MMKKILFVLAFSFVAVLSASAQKFAYVDIDKILNSLDEYKAANEVLDKTANTWRQEVAQELDKVKGLYNKYQAEQVLLSDEARKQREDEIMAKEKAIRDKQKDLFGPEGSLFKKRQELVRPIQDKVYAAIEKYAQQRGYDFIFDKATAGAIFTNPAFDKTDDVLKIIR